MQKEIHEFRILVETRNLRKMTKNECIIYSLIVAFNSAGKQFFFSNEVLCDSLKICKKTLLNSLHKLEDKEMIIIKYYKNKRYISLNLESKTLDLFKKVYKNGRN